MSLAEAGITFERFWFYLPLTMSVGIALGWGESKVLHFESLFPDSSIKSIIALILVMIIIIGIIEEFMFRSALQTLMMERIGSSAGILISSTTFGIMYSSYHLPQEFLYITFAGLIFGLLFWITRSLPVIAVTHGIANISLFLVAPVYPELLIYLFSVPGILFLLIAFYSKISIKKKKRTNPNEEKR